jgi:phosphatidylinositol glycan class V
VLAPFIYHQWAAYREFCYSAEPALWCSNVPPSIYNYVQKEYWDNGFLRYWTIQQLPNFLISAPPLTSISIFSIYHIHHALSARFFGKVAHRSPFIEASLMPHAIHALILSATLLFASNTQIVLRLAASLPITYWAAAWLVVEHPQWGKWWITWSVTWGSLSAILWGAFLPPA